MMMMNFVCRSHNFPESEHRDSKTQSLDIDMFFIIPKVRAVFRTREF